VKQRTKRRFIMTRVAVLFITLCALIGFGGAYAQEGAVDRVNVELTDPSKPVYVELSLVNGGITVSAYDGNEVIVEASTRTKKISEDDEKTEGKNGMFRIQTYSTSLEVEEHNNKIDISTQSWKRAIDINLKVPRRTSLNLRCVNSGDIYVVGVEGELDVSNVNGSVTMREVSGSAIAHALNGDLIVTFDSIDSDKPMSFSSLNGDVDVTFPGSLRCDVKIKNDMGDVYSDFEISQVDKPVDVFEDNDEEADGKYRIRIERTFFGTINGGGPEFIFKNFNGDILIRSSNG
jgi:DUF4097 and DUF4098 domain-containing protein YvlB